MRASGAWHLVKLHLNLKREVRSSKVINPDQDDAHNVATPVRPSDSYLPAAKRGSSTVQALTPGAEYRKNYWIGIAHQLHAERGERYNPAATLLKLFDDHSRREAASRTYTEAEAKIIADDLTKGPREFAAAYPAQNLASGVEKAQRRWVHRLTELEEKPALKKPLAESMVTDWVNRVGKESVAQVYDRTMQDLVKALIVDARLPLQLGENGPSLSGGNAPLLDGFRFQIPVMPYRPEPKHFRVQLDSIGENASWVACKTDPKLTYTVRLLPELSPLGQHTLFRSDELLQRIHDPIRDRQVDRALVILEQYSLALDCFVGMKLCLDAELYPKQPAQFRNWLQGHSAVFQPNNLCVYSKLHEYSGRLQRDALSSGALDASWEALSSGKVPDWDAARSQPPRNCSLAEKALQRQQKAFQFTRHSKHSAVPKYLEVPFGADYRRLDAASPLFIPTSLARTPAGSTLQGFAAFQPSRPGWVSIPCPSLLLFQVRALKVNDAEGNTLVCGVDYTCHQDATRSILALKLGANTSDRLTFELQIAPISHSDPPAEGAYNSLKIGRLRSIASGLKPSGFVPLAGALTRLCATKKIWRRPLSLQQVERAFIGTGLYSYYAGDKTKTNRGAFGQHAQFLDKAGRACAQCDGANDLADDFLTEYFKDSPHISVEARNCYSLSGISEAAEVTTVGQDKFHRHLLIIDDRGINAPAYFDATAQKNDRRLLAGDAREARFVAALGPVAASVKQIPSRRAAESVRAEREDQRKRIDQLLGSARKGLIDSLTSKDGRRLKYPVSASDEPLALVLGLSRVVSDYLGGAKDLDQAGQAVDQPSIKSPPELGALIKARAKNIDSLFNVYQDAARRPKHSAKYPAYRHTGLSVSMHRLIDALKASAAWLSEAS